MKRGKIDKRKGWVMRCPDCGRRMRGNGSRAKKGGEILRHMRCPECRLKCVTLEKIIVVQRVK